MFFPPDRSGLTAIENPPQPPPISSKTIEEAQLSFTKLPSPGRSALTEHTEHETLRVAELELELCLGVCVSGFEAGVDRWMDIGDAHNHIHTHIHIHTPIHPYTPIHTHTHTHHFRELGLRLTMAVFHHYRHALPLLSSLSRLAPTPMLRPPPRRSLPSSSSESAVSRRSPTSPRLAASCLSGTSQ